MLTQRIRRIARSEPGTRSLSNALSLDTYVQMLNSFGYLGIRYTLPGAKQEEPSGDFVSRVRLTYKSNGVVFACMAARQMLFQEARFQFREMVNGRAGQLFGTPALGPLEHPWQSGTTGDLLAKAIQYQDLGGNTYVVRRPGGKLRVLRPDWVTLVLGSEFDDDVAAWDVDADVIGFIYQPGGPGSRRPIQTFLPEQVAHWTQYPDPEAQYRGMSWLTPVVREIMADKGMTEHKLAFTENGATPNMLVKMDVDDVDAMAPWIQMFKEQHEGAGNAYATLFLGAGMDATVVGKDMRQMDFKTVQGAGETRIAAAARVPPIIVGLSEGLEAATYSNYGQARRAFADLCMRPLWRGFCGALEPIIDLPEPRVGGEPQLWYADNDIPFLMEDQTDAAEVISFKAGAISTLWNAAFEADSCVDAVESGDLTRLKHTGLDPVQAQKTGAPPPQAKVPPTTSNGSEPKQPAPA